MSTKEEREEFIEEFSSEVQDMIDGLTEFQSDVQATIQRAETSKGELTSLQKFAKDNLKKKIKVAISNIDRHTTGKGLKEANDNIEKSLKDLNAIRENINALRSDYLNDNRTHTVTVWDFSTGNKAPKNVMIALKTTHDFFQEICHYWQTNHKRYQQMFDQFTAYLEDPVKSLLEEQTRAFEPKSGKEVSEGSDSSLSDLISGIPHAS